MRTPLQFKREARIRQLEELLSLLDDVPGSGDRSSSIGDEGSYTEDNGITEFGWKTVEPWDVVEDNQSLDQESTRSEIFRQKTENGQGLV